MSVDFEKFSQQVEPIDKFGIVDPDDKEGKKPSKIVYNSNETWGATVICNYRGDYKFIPVDNNIPLSKISEEGVEETASSCDAIVYTNKTICLIELKNTKTSASLNHAMEQLESTIDFAKFFINKFNYKRAYISNIGQPRFNKKFSNTQRDFYHKNKIILRISTIIEELH